MSRKDDEFRKRLFSIFKVEAAEHLGAMTSGLMEMEKEVSPEFKAQTIERLFREAHSLKGAARSVGMADIETICQSLEGVFSALKRNDIVLYPALFDELHKVIDNLNEMISSSLNGEGSRKGVVDAIKEELSKVEAGELIQVTSPVTGHAEPAKAEKAAETVRISADKMGALLVQAEEILSVKLAVNQQANDITSLLSMFALWDKEWSKKYPVIRDFRRTLEKTERTGDGGTQNDVRSLKLLEFLDWTEGRIKAMESRMADLRKEAESNRHSISTMVDSLLEEFKRSLALPFSTLLEALPKLVRVLLHEQGKRAELSLCGEDIEIDRRILEEMRIVFTHLARNSIDHGIEKAEERAEKGKPETGRIAITFSRVEGSKVEITFSDDGRGVDTGKLREVWAKQKPMTQLEGEVFSEEEVLSTIFRSGVSTSPIITDISGRGLGLAIAQEKVETLGGRIWVETRRNEGTLFRMIVPVSIATFRGILVSAGGQEFIIPIAVVEKVSRTRPDEIKTVENRETISFDGTTIPLVWLNTILELKAGKSDQLFMPIVIVASMDTRIGFVVDEVLGEQEVLIKNFGPQISRIRNVSGAAVLGSGKVVPVLNVSDLVKTVIRHAGISTRPNVAQVQGDEKKISILVVEDSITSRILLKNILESAGYSVRTAVDGIDAITRLKTEPFALVVSDVDMPRMNGFDLTAKIRSDNNLSGLPVVLVTALDSPADREHGIDAGANAYIVKSSFDQSNLLEAVRRLL